jgi:hypothetical protein
VPTSSPVAAATNGALAEMAVSPNDNPLADVAVGCGNTATRPSDPRMARPATAPSVVGEFSERRDR